MDYSESESKRFEKVIYRNNSNEFQPSILRKSIIDKGVDILILRLPTPTVNNHYKIESVGFPYLHADTLVSYSINLSRAEINKPRNNLVLEVIDAQSKVLLSGLISDIFGEYKNHYASNPYLDSGKITEGFAEWAESYVGEQNRISWLVKKEDELVGFATCSYDDQSKECTGVLYGVLPKFSGKGIYSDIIRLTQQYFKERDYVTMWVSTQVQNYAVQKSWNNEGFTLRKSVETYHINSMLSYSITPEKSSTFSIKPTEIDEYAEYSGDKNSLHIDSSYAQRHGFSDRVAHGMLIMSKITKYLGVSYPGEGSIFVGNNNLFLAPIYPNIEYQISFSTYNISRNGIMNIVAKVANMEGQVCLLSYNKLINTKVSEEFLNA